MRFTSKKIALLTAAAAALSVHGVALGFQSTSDLVLVQVNEPGNGSGGFINGGGDAASLQEYTPAGSAVGAPINLQTPTGAQLTLPDIEDHDGQLTASVNGNVLTMGAYLAPAGATAPNTLAPSVAPRTIITIDGNGNLNTATQLTGATDYNPNNPVDPITPANAVPAMSIRQVTSIDGTQFWLSGNNNKLYASPDGGDVGGVRYTTLGASTSTSLNGGFGFDARTTAILNGQLFVDTGSSNSPDGKHTVFSTSPALPTSGTPTYTALTTNGTTVINGNQSPIFLNVGGSTVLYETDSTNSAIDKYLENSNGTWTSEGAAKLNGAEDVIATVSGNNVSLYVTTSNALYSAIDTSGTGSIATTLFGATPVPLVSAAPGEQFRGLALAVPEPTTLSLLSLVALPLLGRRRRR
jgi:hypothetical protein